MIARTHRLAALLVALALGCGGAAHPSTPTIDQLRQRARELPNDPDAQRALAEAELLLSGGDATRAHAQLDRALALSPDDVRLHYLRALERELHGHPSEALDAHLEVIRRATEAEDPLAPVLAEISAAEIEGLDDSVPELAERLTRGLAPVHARPGRLGEAARSTIADILIDLAYRRADLERVRALTAAQRCATEWRVAGPFGPRHLLGFDEALAPERDEALGDRYDYGHGRGARETRTARARGCSVHLGGGPVGGPGTTYAETTLELPEGGTWLLRLETPNAVALSVDGREIARLDRRVEPLGRVTWHPVELAAGAHRVRVKITTRHPNPVLGLGASRAPAPPDEVPGESLLSAYARVQRAMSLGDAVSARELAAPHLSREGSPAFLVAGAAASLNDPLRSAEVRHDTARRLLGWAADRDEQAWFPRLTLAQLEANEGRDVAAVEALRDASERWPELVILPLQLVDWLEQRGWHAEADAMVQRARAIVPDACRPRRAALNQARRRSRAAEELEHAEALVACDARSDALFSTHLRRRQWDEALAALARVSALEPEESPVGVLSARVGVAQSRGDEALLQQLVRELSERMPQSITPVLLEVDRVLARGDAQAARARLDGALGAEPESMAELRRVSRALFGDSPLERYRRDGAEVIRELEASGRRYEEPMVLVFDYTVYRVFEDGSMLELTHNIFRLQSQEAVDAMGEFAVPDGAQMLTLRTVKQDGRRLEPDEIAGKDTISFPSLAPGDYIEFEYLRPRGAPAGYPGGFVGDRFYFRNFETPFDLSQLTVVTPSSVELVVDPRGPAPRTEERVEEGTRVYRWTVRESRPMVQEPGSVSSHEFFPSIYWGHGATWAMYVESLRDVLADRDVRDPAAVRLVRQITGERGDRASAEGRARAIYRWVLENVEDSDDVFGLAPAMLAARTGNRARVLRYLLEVAGLDADLVLARSYAADATESDLPNDETYQNVLVRVRGAEGHHWLHTGLRGAPFGYVPPVLAGMDALVLNEAGERARVAERPLEADRRVVELDVELTRAGGARLEVVETFHGTGAVLWREQLEEVPDADLQQRFESAYVASLVPGGRLTRLAISGREDPEQPLVLRYEVETEALARRARGDLVVAPLYRARLGPQLAPVASRTTAQLVAAGQALDVELRVRAPEGSSIASAPRDVTIEGPHGARVRIASERSGSSVVVRRAVRVPRMRVEPREYPDFARFCRAADEAEAAEIGVRLGG